MKEELLIMENSQLRILELKNDCWNNLSGWLIEAAWMKNRLGSWLRDLIACELLQNCPEPIRRKSVQRNSVKKKVSLGFWCICLNSKVKMVFVCDLPKKSINVSAVIHSHASSTLLFFFFLAIPVQPVGSFPNQESNPCPSYSRRVES